MYNVCYAFILLTCSLLINSNFESVIGIEIDFNYLVGDFLETNLLICN